MPSIVTDATQSPVKESFHPSRELISDEIAVQLEKEEDALATIVCRLVHNLKIAHTLVNSAKECYRDHSGLEESSIPDLMARTPSNAQCPKGATVRSFLAPVFTQAAPLRPPLKSDSRASHPPSEALEAERTEDCEENWSKAAANDGTRQMFEVTELLEWDLNQDREALKTGIDRLVSSAATLHAKVYFNSQRDRESVYARLGDIFYGSHGADLHSLTRVDARDPEWYWPGVTHKEDESDAECETSGSTTDRDMTAREPISAADFISAATRTVAVLDRTAADIGPRGWAATLLKGLLVKSVREGTEAEDMRIVYFHSDGSISSAEQDPRMITPTLDPELVRHEGTLTDFFNVCRHIMCDLNSVKFHLL